MESNGIIEEGHNESAEGSRSVSPGVPKSTQISYSVPIPVQFISQRLKDTQPLTLSDYLYYSDDIEDLILTSAEPGLPLSPTALLTPQARKLNKLLNGERISQAERIKVIEKHVVKELSLLNGNVPTRCRRISESSEEINMEYIFPNLCIAPYEVRYENMKPKLMILVATELEFKTIMTLESWDDKMKITHVPENVIPAGCDDGIAPMIFRYNFRRFPVLVCMCGRGKAASAGMVGYMCGAVPSLEFVLNVGTCAKITPNFLEIGDVCVPMERRISCMNKFFRHAMQDWDFGIQVQGNTIFNADKNLRLSTMLQGVAKTAIPDLKEAFCITSDRKLECNKTAEKLKEYATRHKLGNVIYDMETTSVTEICNKVHKRCLVMRAVSDDGSEELMDSEYKNKNRLLALSRLKSAVNEFLKGMADTGKLDV